MAEQENPSQEKNSLAIKLEISETARQRIQDVCTRVNQNAFDEKVNCWEVVQCGYEQQCEAYKEKNGRLCYLYDHTFCFGEDMGPFHEKIGICIQECPFYGLIQNEVGSMWADAHRQILHLRSTGKLTASEDQLLRQRADQLAQVLQEENKGEMVDLVIFQLGNEWFALDAHHIMEIRQVSDITPVPCTPDHVLGIATIRGNIYSVLDIRNFFGCEDRTVTDQSMFLLTSSRDFQTCLLVDAVLQKQNIARQDIKPTASGLKAIDAGYVSGFIFHDQKIVTLLNWEGFITHSKLIVHEEI